MTKYAALSLSEALEHELEVTRTTMVARNPALVTIVRRPNPHGQPGRILNAGETFYEPPTAVHSVSRNPSTDKRTKIIVFMVANQNNPSTVAE